MNDMSPEDWERFKKEIMAPANSVLSNDLEHLHRLDEVKRIDLWNKLEHNYNILEEEFISRLPSDIMLDSRSKFAFAKLLLATAAHVNDEDSPIIEQFNQMELRLVQDFEKFNIFDILSTSEIVDRIHRRGDIYELVKEFYEGQYSDLDRLLDAPEIEKDIK